MNFFFCWQVHHAKEQFRVFFPSHGLSREIKRNMKELKEKKNRQKIECNKDINTQFCYCKQQVPKKIMKKDIKCVAYSQALHYCSHTLKKVQIEHCNL